VSSLRSASTPPPKRGTAGLLAHRASHHTSRERGRAHGASHRTSRREADGAPDQRLDRIPRRGCEHTRPPVRVGGTLALRTADCRTGRGDAGEWFQAPGAVPLVPEGAVGRIQATTGANLWFSHVAALEQAPGLRVRPAAPERATARIQVPRQAWLPSRRGRTGVAPSNNDSARRLPKKARNDVVHHNRWDSRARRGRSGVASSPLQKSPPHLPERRPGAPSSATTGVILAYCTAILEVALRTSSPACAFPKERQPESESSPGCCPEGLRHVGFEHCGSASAGIRNGSPKLPPSTNLCAPPEGSPPRRIVTTSVIPAVGLAVPELPPGRWTVATQSRGTCHRSPSAGVTEYFTDRGPATSW